MREVQFVVICRPITEYLNRQWILKNYLFCKIYKKKYRNQKMQEKHIDFSVKLVKINQIFLSFHLFKKLFSIITRFWTFFLESSKLLECNRARVFGQFFLQYNLICVEKNFWDTIIIHFGHFTVGKWILKWFFIFVTSLWQTLHSVFGPWRNMCCLRHSLDGPSYLQKLHLKGRSFRWTLSMWQFRKYFWTNDCGHKSQWLLSTFWCMSLKCALNDWRVGSFDPHLSQMNGPFLVRTCTVFEKSRNLIVWQMVKLIQLTFVDLKDSMWLQVLAFPMTH